MSFMIFATASAAGATVLQLFSFLFPLKLISLKVPKTVSQTRFLFQNQFACAGMVALEIMCLLFLFVSMGRDGCARTDDHVHVCTRSDTSTKACRPFSILVKKHKLLFKPSMKEHYLHQKFSKARIYLSRWNQKDFSELWDPIYLNFSYFGPSLG